MAALRARPSRWPTRSRGLPFAAHRRSASQPHTAWRWPTPSTSTRPPIYSRRRARPRSTCAGPSTRCAAEGPAAALETARAIEERERDATQRIADAWRRPVRQERAGADALQHRSAGNDRLRHRAGRDRGGLARRRRRRGLGRRDAAAQPGRALDRLGVDRAGIPFRVITDSSAGLLMSRGQVDRDRRRRRPHRRQRRRGEQDRHLRSGGAGTPPRHPVHRRRPDVDRSIRRRPPAPTSRSRSATRPRCSRLPGGELRVRHHAGRARDRARDGGRRAACVSWPPPSGR